MLKPNIKCHKIGNNYSTPHLFILSKGANAGKPLKTPCPNCFVLVAKTEQEADFYYWLAYGLWQGQFFRPFLTGSVISFIRIQDVIKILTEAGEKANLKPNEFQNAIVLLNTFDQHLAQTLQQIKLIKEAKKVIMYKVLK